MSASSSSSSAAAAASEAAEEATPVPADLLSTTLTEADELRSQGLFRSEFECLLELYESATDVRDDIELLWRLARAHLFAAFAPTIAPQAPSEPRARSRPTRAVSSLRPSPIARTTAQTPPTSKRVPRKRTISAAGANGAPRATRPSEERQLELLERGLTLAHKALEINPRHGPANKVAAMLLGRAVQYYSSKERIQKSHEIRYFTEQAVQALPHDFEPHYMLARWCFRHASMGWLERAVYSTLFAEPPTATLEEALSHALEAFEINPSDIRTNHLLAQIYSALENETKSRFLLQEVHSPDPKGQKGRRVRL